MQTTIDLRQLVEATGDAVVACDAEGLITLWNPAAERLFGYAESEALGQSLDLIIPERFRTRHWSGFGETMATGRTRHARALLRVPATGKTGAALSVSFTIALLRGADGNISGMASIIRDETEKFNEERALRKRLAELEAQARA